MTFESKFPPPSARARRMPECLRPTVPGPEAAASWTISGKAFEAVPLKDTRNLLILAPGTNRNRPESLGFTRHFNLKRPKRAPKAAIGKAH
jgi:hypothetical protein